MIDDIEAWRSGVSGLIAAGGFDATWSVDGLAARLVALDRCMKEAPAEVRNSFARLPDVELREAAEARRSALERGELPWSIGSSRDPLDLVRGLAVEILATDLGLDDARGLQPPVDPDIDYEAPALGTLVIPCRSRRTGARGRDGQGYPRRGLLRHRILPRRVGSLTVKLSGGRDVARSREPAVSLKAGAALFSDLAVRVERPSTAPGLFRIVEAESPRDEEQLRQALTGAHVERCDVLAWPELTMPPRRVELVRRWLGERLLDPGADDHRVGVTVAGSWHHPKGEKVVNRAPVLGPTGKPLLQVDKRLGFHAYGFGSEDLHPGGILHVLLLDGALIGFGICRDFADDGPDNPFGVLDLDWVLVPSMGNPRTTGGHLLTAGLACSRFTTGAFVVQQQEPREIGDPVPPPGPLGTVVCGTVAREQAEEFRVWLVDKG